MTKAPAGLLRAYIADALDCFQLRVVRGEDLLESAELGDDPLDQQLGKTRNAPENPVASRLNRMIERVDLAVVPQQFGQPAEVQQVLMGKSCERVEDKRKAVLGVVDHVVVDERDALRCDAD